MLPTLRSGKWSSGSNINNINITIDKVRSEQQENDGGQTIPIL